MPETKAETRWLLNRANGRTFPYSPNLAKRPGMEIITAGQAAAINNKKVDPATVQGNNAAAEKLVTDDRPEPVAPEVPETPETPEPPAEPPKPAEEEKAPEPPAAATEAPAHVEAPVTEAPAPVQHPQEERKITKENVVVADVKDVPDDKLDDFAKNVLNIGFPPPNADYAMTDKEKREKIEKNIKNLEKARIKKAQQEAKRKAALEEKKRKAEEAKEAK